METERSERAWQDERQTKTINRESSREVVDGVKHGNARKQTKRRKIMAGEKNRAHDSVGVRESEEGR